MVGWRRARLPLLPGACHAQWLRALVAKFGSGPSAPPYWAYEMANGAFSMIASLLSSSLGVAPEVALELARSGLLAGLADVMGAAGGWQRATSDCQAT